MSYSNATSVVAYFDVDHTLTRIGSLESFVRFFAKRPEGEAVSSRLSGLLSVAGRTVDLHEIHDAYANVFRGESWERVREVGREWHGAVAKDLYRAGVVRELAAHQLHGRQVVLVSGSWDACLRPIARRLQVETVLRSEPALASDGNTLVGAFDLLMVGEQKAVAVREHASSVGADLAACYAYGDHVSDEPLLSSVGNAVVVGDDHRLAEIAAARKWRVMAGEDGSVRRTYTTVQRRTQVG